MRRDTELRRQGDAEALGAREIRKVPADLQRRALRRLAVLNAAASLGVLRAVPGNRLEKLSGDRAGQHSVRINEQYRVCFVWESGDAYEVEVTDYH
jgi:toxin HigB-1